MNSLKFGIIMQNLQRSLGNLPVQILSFCPISLDNLTLFIDTAGILY